MNISNSLSIVMVFSDTPKMPAKFFLLLLLAKLTAAVINSDEFYSVYEEFPKRQPRILSKQPEGEGNSEELFPYLDSIEETDLNTNRSISDNGFRVVQEIARSLRLFEFRPIVLLIQDKDEVLDGVDIYMGALFAQMRIVPDFWIMKFNASGVSGVLARSATSDISEFRRHFAIPITSEYSDPQRGTAATFFGLLKATRVLPPRSAILMFTDSRIEDEELAPLSIRETVRKEISLFSVWMGPYPSLHHEENLIRDASYKTRGSFFVGNTERKSMNNNNVITDNERANYVITHQNNVLGNRFLDIPVDNGVDRIHVSLSGNVNKARFTTPKGRPIDLLNSSDVSQFSRGSYIFKAGETFEIDINTAHSAQATPVVGTWRLETDAATLAQHNSHYNITVSARTNLKLDAMLIHDNGTGSQGMTNQVFRMDLQGDIAKVDHITFVLENGSQKPLNFRPKENIKNPDDIETFQGANIDIDVKDLPKASGYVRVRGKDVEGNEFQRMAYYNPNNIYNVIQPTTIELVEGSELLVTPNRASNLLFQVSNNRNQVILVFFQCRDEKRYLRFMQPRWAWINPHQKVIVTVSTITPPTPIGDRDLITFAARSGTERIEKSVILMINTNSRQYDNISPHMWHTYTSNCLNVLLGNCEDHTWTIQVTAQDKETGMLSLTSSPEGLYFPQGYISGTTEEITGTFSGSCCQSSIVLTAVDVVHNRRSYVADAYWARLDAGAISAVVLGILFLVILIVIIVVCCKKGACKCGKKESDSWDVSKEAYRGPASSSSTRRY